MLEKIREIVDPSKIDYVISNHFEIDHSGSLSEILKIALGAEVICSEKGKEVLSKYEKNLKTVKTGDELQLGRRTLLFITAPMLPCLIA